MLKENNLSDLTDIDQARRNLWVPSFDQVYTKEQVYAKSESYSKEEVNDALSKKADLTDGKLASSLLPSPIDQGAESLSNKKETIEWNQTSNLFYPTVKAVWDWVTGLLSKKADLIDGKVPASQLPEVNQIDESNIVHKSWDETIGGKKSFNEGVYFDRSFGLNTLDANGNKTKLYWNSLRAPNNHHHILPDLVNQDGGISSIYIGYNGQQNEIGLSVKWKTNYLLIKDDLNMYINDQNRTGEWQDYTPTLSGSWGGTPAKYWSQRWRYKIIWKMCFWWAKVEFQKWTLSWRPYISLPNKSKWEWESIGAESLVWWTGTTLKNTYWYSSINDGKIEILHWFGQAGDWSAIESWDMAISVKFFYEIE